MLQIRKRLTYANVMSSIAVFLVLGGATAVAFNLPRNSVGTKQLKKNAVTGVKVKDQSLTGKDINLGKLGVVPSAATANSIPPAEPSHLIGASGEPAFQSGSSDYGPAGPFKLQSVGFYKDHEGIVHLQGLAKVGTASPFPGLLFFLPPGYRPASGQTLFFNVFCVGEPGSCATDSPGGDKETYSRLLILGSNVSEGSTPIDGAVVANPGTAVSLDGITFRAES